MEIEKINPVKLKQGEQGSATISLTVGKEFHIQANPATAANLIPTTVELTLPKGLTADKPLYPQGHPYQQEGAKAPISVYSDRVVITIPLTADVTAFPGKLSVKGRLRFQACNDKICFFPKTLPLTIPIAIASRQISPK